MGGAARLGSLLDFQTEKAGYSQIESPRFISSAAVANSAEVINSRVAGQGFCNAWSVCTSGNYWAIRDTLYPFGHLIGVEPSL